MIFMLKLALKSLLSRKVTVGLSCLAIAIGLTLLLAIERVRLGARESFAHTISQTDLVVGARTGTVSLLLSSVFHIGYPAHGLSFKTYEKFKAHPAVQWTVPISMGDSHRGHRVVATASHFFEHYRHSRAQPLSFAAGGMWQDEFDVILGSEVAKKLQYAVGSNLTLSHGSGSVSFQEHADHPFQVVGVLKPTLTPLDRALFISLEAMDHLHEGNENASNTQDQAHKHLHSHSHSHEHNSRQITAFFLGAKSRLDTLALQREINLYENEALTAIVPALTLHELWTGVGFAESALKAVSLMVLLATLVALAITVVGALNERRREIAIFRSLGSSSVVITALLLLETLSISLVASFLSIIFVFGVGPLVQLVGHHWMGLQIPWVGLTPNDWIYILAVNLIAGAIGAMAGLRAAALSLADGLQTRL
jgi:putative ABC transport system permease protein